MAHLGLLIGDAVDGETAFHIVDQTEVLSSLLNGDHICNPKQYSCLLQTAQAVGYKSQSLAS